MLFKPGDLVTTHAGNYVYRLLKETTDQPPYYLHIGDRQWEALLLFDASGVGSLLDVKMIGTKNMVKFDALRLGMLWTHMDLLIRECTKDWSEDDDDGST